MIRRNVENEIQRRAVLANISTLPIPFRVAAGELGRTPAQNRRYWGRGALSQIAEQATINGQKFSAEAWHEQFKRMFIGIVELPNGQVVGKSSAALGKRKFADFCSEVEAYAATELGVFFVDLRPVDDWS